MWRWRRNRNCGRDYSIAHRDGYRILNNVFKHDIGGEFMYGYGCGAGVGGYAGVGVIAIAVLILIALGVIF